MRQEQKASTVRNPYRKADDAKDQTRSYSTPAQVVAFLGYRHDIDPSWLFTRSQIETVVQKQIEKALVDVV